MNNSTTVKNRICFLDELRGLAVIAMVLYHILYSMSFIFALEFSYPAMRAVIPYEPNNIYKHMRHMLFLQQKQP